MAATKQTETTGGVDPQVANVLRQAKAQMLRLREKLSEPLAIIGMGCRFPGANGPDEYWDLLSGGRCAISETPANRWAGSLKAADSKEAGKITANCGGYIQDIDQFDAGFFGISAREAETMDPQQRILLEVVWETLENAGLNPHSTRGARVGAFVGICSNDYLHLLTNNAGRDYSDIDAYLGTGNAHSVAAGRLSYVMHWQGPSMSVDTACSSSLTAVHMAARSLRYGDCDLAVAAGVNVILSPELSISLSQAGMLSPTGKCHTFDAAADGFVRGEGCGAILMKRLSQAVEDGDRIYCVIQGTAANQDGRSNGLTAPNGGSQQEVIRRALADGRVTPADVDYIEAHGTGTQLGDPIEISGLKGVFAAGRTEENPLKLGSAKTNLGHLEAAAGIAGVIKLALSLHHGQLPPHLHFESPSQQIDWDWHAKPITELQPWQKVGDKPRVAGVSSFGFGGSNAHAVLAGAPKSNATLPPAEGAQLFVLSAKSKDALKQLAGKYMSCLRSDAGSLSLAEICYTAAVGRAALEERLAVVVNSVEDLANQLEDFAEGVPVVDAQNAPAALTNAKANYLAGHDVDWTDVFPQRLRKIDLPTYAFQRKRYWFTSSETTSPAKPTAASNALNAAANQVGHPLLGSRLDLATADAIFETDLQSFDFISDHKIDGSVVFPAAGLLELAVAAGHEVIGALPVVQNLEIEKPIVLISGQPCRVQVVVHAISKDIYQCQIANHVGGKWRTTARCELSVSDQLHKTALEIPARNGHSTAISVKSHYEVCREQRIDYGRAFQGVTKLYTGGDISWGETELPILVSQQGYHFHPAWLDACLQVAAAAIPLEHQAGLIPVGIERFEIFAQPGENDTLLVSARVVENEQAQLIVYLKIACQGETLAKVEALTLKPFTKEIKAESDSATSSQVSTLVEEWLALPEEQRDAAVRSYLHARVAEVMGTQTDEVPLDKPLDGLGLDSLMAFELRDELERNLNVMIPMEVFLQEITLNDFSGLVSEKLVSPGFATKPDKQDGDDVAGENWIEGEI